jgi:hypothetical protein
MIYILRRAVAGIDKLYPDRLFYNGIKIRLLSIYIIG